MLREIARKELPDLTRFRMDELVCGKRIEYDVAANWKLICENYSECYHCAGNHPELCKTFPEAPTVTGVNGAESDPEMLEHWAKCEAAGLAARFRIDPDDQYRAMTGPGPAEK